MQLMLELYTMLMVVVKAHPKLQAMLNDVQQYKPTWIVGGISATPLELDFTSSTLDEWENKPDELVNLATMHCAKISLDKVTLLPKVRFVLGKAVHIEFDGSF